MIFQTITKQLYYVFAVSQNTNCTAGEDSQYKFFLQHIFVITYLRNTLINKKYSINFNVCFIMLLKYSHAELQN